jgi:hypothetical protein
VQAHFDDLSDLLRKYTSLPRPVEVETRKRVVGMLRDLPTRPQKQADSYDIKTSLAIRFGKKRRPLDPETRLKRVQSAARAAVLNDLLDRMLKQELGNMQGVSQTERWTALAPFGRKVWSVLRRTMSKKPETRERNLAEVLEQWCSRNPELRQSFEHVPVAVQAYFKMLEQRGDLSWKPAYKPVEKKQKRRRRPATQ